VAVDPSYTQAAADTKSASSSTFTVEADNNHRASVQFDIDLTGRQSGDTVTVELIKIGAGGIETVVKSGTFTSDSLNNATLFNGAITESGTYKLKVTATDNSSSGNLSVKLEDVRVTSYGYTEPTYAWVAAVLAGNVITDLSHGTQGIKDDLGTEGARVISVHFNGTDYVVPANGSVVIPGLYGDLTIHSNGSYSYQADGNEANLGKTETFTYTLAQPDGDSSSANLVIGISETTYAPNVINDGSGSNTVNGTAGNDVIFGNGGNDTINGGEGNDHLDGGTGNDTLNGGNGNDVLLGGAGDDTLNGGAGNDALLGGIGNDILTGGAGNDILTGGEGSDIFVWNSEDIGTVGTPASDIVTDFNVNEDVLNVTDLLTSGAGLTMTAVESNGHLQLQFSNGSGVVQTIDLNTVAVTDNTAAQTMLNNLLANNHIVD
jgi:VCBS repeat-containing protein